MIALQAIVRILAISGSLQATSSNTRFVRTMEAQSPAGVEITVFDRVGVIPHFNPDLDREPAPEAVADLRRRIGAADVVVIASPEYAHGIPGSLKNALDWVVGSGEMYGKRVVVVSVSPRADGGPHAREALARTLGAQGAAVVASKPVQVVRPRADMDNTRAMDDAIAAVFDVIAADDAVTSRPGPTFNGGGDA